MENYPLPLTRRYIMNVTTPDRFTLIFSGPGNFFFPQGNYVFPHESLGEVPVFLIPIGKTEAGFRYQVVYSVEK